MVLRKAETMTDVGIKPFLCEMIEKASIRGEWEKWLRSLELYLAAEEIGEKKKKRDKLLHLGGAQLQEVAFNLSGAIEEDPTQDKDIFKILVDKLTEYFSPTRNSVFELHVFRSLKPHEGEMFNKFVLRIRHQATKCTFGKNTRSYRHKHDRQDYRSLGTARSEEKTVKKRTNTR